MCSFLSSTPGCVSASYVYVSNPGRVTNAFLSHFPSCECSYPNSPVHYGWLQVQSLRSIRWWMPTFWFKRFRKQKDEGWCSSQDTSAGQCCTYKGTLGGFPETLGCISKSAWALQVVHGEAPHVPVHHQGPQDVKWLGLAAHTLTWLSGIWNQYGPQVPCRADSEAEWLQMYQEGFWDAHQRIYITFSLFPLQHRR